MSCHLWENNTSILLRIICVNETAAAFQEEYFIRRGSSAGDNSICWSQITNKRYLSDLVTLKMAALCGRGGAGRDGDVAFDGGGWFGAVGPLIAALTDLEYKEEITHL